MMSFWMWWQGYVTVRLQGPDLERLLNNMAELDICLYKVDRPTLDVMLVVLEIKDFKRLRPLLWNSQVNVSILDKHGAPFFFATFRNRTFLALGCLLSLLLLAYLSNFIWFIEVKGGHSLPLTTLQEVVQELGVQSGVARSTIEPRVIEGELLKRFPTLAWAQVSLKGTRMEISLTEREGVQNEYTRPGNLYADYDGVITDVFVLQGTPKVRASDTVRKGDLLVSGEYYDARGRKQFGAAQGVVKARVWYEAVGEAPLIKWEPIYTGKSRRQYVLTLGSINIPLGRKYPRETHLPSAKEWQLSLGRAMVPLRLTEIIYREVEYQQTLVPRQEAETTAYRLAWESLLEQGVQREQVREERQKVDVMADADGIRVTVQVELVRDIGVFRMD